MELEKLFGNFLLTIGFKGDAAKVDAENPMTIDVYIPIKNQKYKANIFGNKDTKQIIVSFSAPFQVKAGKFVDACMLFNYINDHYSYAGRLSVNDEGDIQYKEIINVADLELDSDIIHIMIEGGKLIFTEIEETIAAVALTSKSYEAIRLEYDKWDAYREVQRKEKKNEARAKGKEYETPTPDNGE